MLIQIPKDWQIPEREATPESVYLNRREILKAVGFLASPLAVLGASGQYPAKQNKEFTLDRPVTEEFAAIGYNNFYEFGLEKERVKDRTGKFVSEPWTIQVTGLVKKPGKWDMDQIFAKFPLEERLYRFRCVEAWSMAVPWTGFPLAEF